MPMDDTDFPIVLIRTNKEGTSIKLGCLDLKTVTDYQLKAPEKGGTSLAELSLTLLVKVG